MFKQPFVHLSLWYIQHFGNLLLSLCLVDIMFIIDILINFRTTYVNDQEESRVNNWPSYYLQLSKQRRHFSKKENLPNDNAGNSWILRLNPLTTNAIFLSGLSETFLSDS